MSTDRSAELARSGVFAEADAFFDALEAGVDVLNDHVAVADLLAQIAGTEDSAPSVSAPLDVCDPRGLPRPRLSDPLCPHCDLAVRPSNWDRHLKFRCPVLNEKRGAAAVVNDRG